MWTNAALQQLFNEKGDQINSISFNNGKYLFIGYNGKYAVQLEDISFKTYGGVDLIVVKHRAKTQGPEVMEWEDWMTTEFIEGIDIITDPEQAAHHRIDGFLLK